MSIFEDTASHTSRPRPLKVAVLGCSGSIGAQALDVCRQHADKVQVVALSVHGSTDSLVKAAREFRVPTVAVSDPAHAHDAILDELPAGTTLLVGPDALVDLVQLPEVDCVVNALVGFAGIEAGYHALLGEKILAYANKESIVVAGDLLMPLAKPAQLIPVDSEHSAIYQCLVGEHHEDIHTIWLTCSGGPFYGKTRKELKALTPADALAHPTWNMGAKITIDSATLMNKGLEILEARQLFDVPTERIHVLVQRQSRIHSMVEFADGSVKAQLGPSDMRIPIQYALSYPERWESPAERVNYCNEPALSFGEADDKTFGCLALAKQAGQAGGTVPCIMNAANEIANAAFRSGRCGFLDIERIVGSTMDAFERESVTSIAQLEEFDMRARHVADSLVEGGGTWA
ncbi:MAG: 1-deoxy-D-xylulose-5-phosphate reductoisomerase [Atopobiaceae bacterium]